MKNKVTLALMLLSVIASTIMIYYLLFDRYSTLFYINISIACVAEIILLGSIPILSDKKLLTFKNVTTSIILNSYVVIAFLWTICYTVFTQNEESDYNPLYIGLLIISVIFIITLGVVEIGGNIILKQEFHTQNAISSKKKILISLDSYWFDIESKLSNIDSEWKDDTLRNLKMILERTSMIPAEKLKRNEYVIDEINSKLNELKELFRNISETNNMSETQSNITNKINQFKNFILTIKSYL